MFPGRGKVREFCRWSGKFGKDLERHGKVREFENKWLWQADSENLFILFKRGKDVLSHEKEKNCFVFYLSEGMENCTMSGKSQGILRWISGNPVNNIVLKFLISGNGGVIFQVLTSKACSEEGLEDATNLLLQLSWANNVTREAILQLLLDGARELGLTVCQNIR